MQDLKTLDLLVALARHRNFTEAARHTGMSVAAASKTISRLEQELGVALFNRTTRSTSPTHQGRILIERAEQALSQIADGINLLQREKTEPDGQVSLLMSTAIGKSCIIPALPDFLERYPKVRLELRLYDANPDLMEQGFDIAVTDWVAAMESHVSRPLCILPIVLVASPDYLSRHGKPDSPEQLAQHDCLNIRMASGKLVEWRFTDSSGNRAKVRHARGAYEFVPEGRIVVVEQYDGITEAVLAGLGIAMVYFHSVLPHLQAGRLKLLLPDHGIQPGAIESNRFHIRYRNRKYLPMAQRVLIDYLVEHFRRDEYLKFDRKAFAV